RCFTDVRDSVRAVAELSTLPQAVGEVFNVGNPREISILDLARLVIQLTESRSGIRLIPYDEAYSGGFEDMPRRVPNAAKLRRYLGWAPEIPLESNLERIIESMRREALAGVE